MSRPLQRVPQKPTLDLGKMRVERVAVIGAGPGGLAAAKYLRAENTFSAISIFEQRDEAGGVWCYTSDNTIDKSFVIPHTRPQTTPEQPVLSTSKVNGDDNIVFQSPVYDQLETNIPHGLMSYSDWKFPTGTSLFPSHQAVKEYLQGYAKELLTSISFHTQVVDVKPVNESQDSGWVVSTLDLKTKQQSTHEFDAVVVANGHYSDHYVPDITGIKEWNAAYPGSISHSKHYRRAEEYSGKKVVVVGNSASGIDVSVQIAAVAQQPLLVSERSESPAYLNNNPNIRLVPEIAEFVITDRSLRFINGHVETDVDHVLFCTGYLYSFPFLSSLTPPPVTVDGSRPSNLFEHIFYSPRPTLTFMGLPQKIIPFPLSEAQAAVIARVYSGRLAIVSQQAMQNWEKSWIMKHGSGKSFNVLGFPDDAEYLNGLHAWSMRATRRDGLDNGGQGKLPPYWDEKDRWVRKLTPMIKAASQALGSKRRDLTTLEELGFVYEEGVEDEKVTQRMKQLKR